MTFEEMIKLSPEDQSNLYKRLKGIRQKAKVVNFSATYGVGAKTLARNMGTSEKEAQSILKAYWDRNWAVKTFADSCNIKVIGEQMWVQQPVSKFWYTLRTKKDVFSTVNQSTAVYIFDLWVKELRGLSFKISGQMHDESVLRVRWDNLIQSYTSELFKTAMDNINNKLKLNLEVSYSVDFGRTYLDVH